MFDRVDVYKVFWTVFLKDSECLLHLVRRGSSIHFLAHNSNKFLKLNLSIRVLIDLTNHNI